MHSGIKSNAGQQAVQPIENYAYPIIPETAFAIRNSQFAIRNSQFAIRNSQFAIFSGALAQKFPNLLKKIKFFLPLLLLTAPPAFAQTWAEYNQTLSLDLGTVQQRYAENDPFGLTTNGVLLTERGNINQLQLAARWQSDLHPVFLQTTASRSNGGTHYDGYLQAGNILTPFAATTGNIMTDVTVRAGVPIARSDSVQWIPFIEFQRHQWDRQLAQYNENFTHTAGLLGVQWQWRPAAWSVELAGAVGQVLSADMQAPSFGFNQTLGNRGLWQLGGTVAYDLTPKWRAHTSLTTRHFGYGQSALQGGVLLPTNQTQQTTLSIGLGWHY